VSSEQGGEEKTRERGGSLWQGGLGGKNGGWGGIGRGLSGRVAESKGRKRIVRALVQAPGERNEVGRGGRI